MDSSAPEPLASWPRRHFQPAGGDAHLFYKIHGVFRGAPEISRSRHRCAGVPGGCDLQLCDRQTQKDLFRLGLDEYIGQDLQRTDRALFDAASSTEQCLVLNGEVIDPPNLDYFRDAVGLVMALLESGGVAVFDPHMFKWWSAAEWRERAFEPAGPVPRHHVVILVSDEPAGGRWYHTRGMRKFGRPDVSVRNVGPELEANVEICATGSSRCRRSARSFPRGKRSRLRGYPRGGAAFTGATSKILISTIGTSRSDRREGPTRVARAERDPKRRRTRRLGLPQGQGIRSLDARRRESRSQRRRSSSRIRSCETTSSFTSHVTFPALLAGVQAELVRRGVLSSPVSCSGARPPTHATLCCRHCRGVPARSP